MNRFTIVLLLMLAALLEAGGDALMRSALHSSSFLSRVAFFALGALTLFAYGYAVNSPPWEFGRLLGLYVCFFFVFAQLIGWLVFRQTPSTAILTGGALIVAGGVIIAVAQA